MLEVPLDGDRRESEPHKAYQRFVDESEAFIEREVEAYVSGPAKTRATGE
jgi:hypothetical protein